MFKYAQDTKMDEMYFHRMWCKLTELGCVAEDKFEPHY